MPRILPFTGGTGYARDIAAVALAAAAYAAISTLGYVEFGVDQTAAAELFFLARLSAPVLIVVAYLSPPAAAWTALGVVLVAWSVGMGTVRGTATVITLTVGLAFAARDHASRHQRTRALRFVAVSIALQLLLRTDVVVAATPGTITWTLVALPLVAGLCLRVLARSRGERCAAVTGGCIVALGPGWSVEGVCTLVALTAALAWRPRDPGLGRRPWGVAMAVVLPIIALTVREPRMAVLALAGALVLLARVEGDDRSRSAPGFARRAAWLGAASLIAVIVAWHGPGLATGHLPRAALMVGLLLPAWATATLTRVRDAWCLLGAGVVLAIAGAGDHRTALTAGVVLIALATGLTTPRTRAATRLQAGWTTGLVAWVVVLRAYPWLRDAPLDTVLDTLSSQAPAAVPGNRALVVVALLTVAILLAAVVEGMTGHRARRLVSLAPVALWCAIALAWLGPVEAPGVVLIDHPTLLGAHRGGWSRRLDSTVPTNGVVVDTNLVQSLALPAGTVLGNVQLLDDEQRSLVTWRLVVGRDTAEWAALRPDIAALPGFVAPAPWTVAAEPRARHFAARFRSHWTLEPPKAAAWITIRRNPSLPDDLQLAIYRLKVHP